jgi:putative transposase
MPSRLPEFARELLMFMSEHDALIHAWCILPNHYHLLVTNDNIISLLGMLGKLHGRTSFKWNQQDSQRGRRQVWCKASERGMRSDRHFWATVNYIHNNPVHHKYVRHWQDWPLSSAIEFLDNTGKEHAEEMWRRYPLLNYGKGWDDPEL